MTDHNWTNHAALRAGGGREPLELCMASLPAPAEKPSHRISESQSHAKLSPPAQVAVFCAAPWPNLQPALTDGSEDGRYGTVDRFSGPVGGRAGSMVLAEGRVARNAGRGEDRFRMREMES